MLQNKNGLSERIADWETNQMGLPEDSEIIWGKVELVLTSSSNKKTKYFTYQYLVAASIITLFVSGIFLYNKLDKKSNQVVSTKKPLRISGGLENSKEVKQPTKIETNILTKNKKGGSLNLNDDVNKPVETKSDQLMAISNETAVESNENIAASVSTNKPPVVNNIDMPIEKNNSSKPNTIFWKPNTIGSKSKFHFPLVHANELNGSSKNALVQYLTDEKPMPNFEVPPPNDVKNKWKITLHPSTTPVALTDNQ